LSDLIPAAEQPAARSWFDAVRAYSQPRVLAILFLGFASGLPFYLVFQTLSFWLRQEGIARSAIGMLSWVSIFYSIKYLWSPLVDRLRLPFLHRLGRRRSWMLLAQLGIAAGLFSLTTLHPHDGVRAFAVSVLWVAFFAATQDIALDAWRIESAPLEQQGTMASAYQVGYRIALITGSAGALTIAGDYGWNVSYAVMAALAGVGVVTTLLVPEPVPVEARADVQREERVVAWLESHAHLPRFIQGIGEWFVSAVICPLVDFFGRYGAQSLLLLAFIGVYRLGDFAIGSMTNSFYVDHGYTGKEVALIVKTYGITFAIGGVLIAGALMARIGLIRSLVLGNALLIISHLNFAILATTHGPTLLGLGLVNAFDNLALALQGTATIAFLSSLTSTRYTATQYALFSSMYALPGKFLEGFSGFVAEHTGWPMFFLYTASLSLPGIFLLFLVVRQRARAAASSELAVAPPR
jgi:PAT family beta-lactamase induction signal transducer AmpG